MLTHTSIIHVSNHNTYTYNTSKVRTFTLGKDNNMIDVCETLQSWIIDLMTLGLWISQYHITEWMYMYIVANVAQTLLAVYFRGDFVVCKEITYYFLCTCIFKAG